MNLLLSGAARVIGMSGRPVYLMLDYDGTLAPIAKTPGLAKIPQATRRLIELAKKRGVICAIISGRTLSDVKKMAGISGIIYAGNHGMQIDGPGLKLDVRPSLRERRALQSARSRILTDAAGIKGVFVEDKGSVLCVHYRLAGTAVENRVKGIVARAAEKYLHSGILKMRGGKMIYELFPGKSWGKGDAVKWLLSRLDKKYHKKKPVIIYAGDDVTDTDAFTELKKKGISIFVGKKKNAPRGVDLNAKNTAELAGFIKELTYNRR